MNTSLASNEGSQDARGDQHSLRATVLATLLGLIAAVLYVLLRQDTTHQYDIYWMLPKLRDGLTNYPRHPFAFPVLDALVAMLDGFGSLHERFKIANGICTGIAVGIFTHAAYLLRANLRQALLVGVTFALLPATVRFATLAELHGIYLPFAAIAIWQTCRMVRAPSNYSPWAGAVLGLLTAIAAGMHGTAHLLVGVAGLWLMVAWWQATTNAPRAAVARKLAGTLLAMVVAHIVATKLIAMGVTAPVDAQWNVVTKDVHTIEGLFATIANELLWPLLPVSVLWPIALFARPRQLAIVFALSLPAYLVTCQLLLCMPGVGYVFHENGAYLEPLAFLAVVIAVRMLPLRLAFLLPAIALTTTTYWHLNPERESPDRNFGVTADAFLASHKVRLIVGGFGEWDGAMEAMIENPEADARRSNVLLMGQLIIETRVHNTVDKDQLALYFHPSVTGRPTVLTTRALEDLRAAGGMFADCVNDVMSKLYEFVPVRYVGDNGAVLTGVELKPRL